MDCLADMFINCNFAILVADIRTKGSTALEFQFRPCMCTDCKSGNNCISNIFAEIETIILLIIRLA